MKFVILGVGQKPPAWVSAGFEDYARRMPREMPLQLVEIRPEPRRSSSLAPAQIDRILAREAERLRAATPPDSVTLALDERGQAVSTQRLADLIAAWRREGRDVVFMIGGADGLHPDLKRSAQLMLSLSAMTFPHQLVRVILAEQLYRAVSLLQGHPYHRP